MYVPPSPGPAQEPTGTGRGCQRPARDGDAPAAPLLLPPQLTTGRQSHLDVLPPRPGATHLLSSSYFDLERERERRRGIKELVWNRLLYSAPRQGARSAEPSVPPCPSPHPPPAPNSPSRLQHQTCGSSRMEEQSQARLRSPSPRPPPKSRQRGAPRRAGQGREPPWQPGTHSISPNWASCFSATCRSFWGSPSRSKRSFSPYRLPRPMVRFVLRRTRVRAMSTATRCWDKPRAAGSTGRIPPSSAGQPGQLPYL